DVEDELIAALRGVEVCVTQMGPLTRRVLDACPELRLFCVSRGGPVHANLAAATEAGGAGTFAPGRNAGATAERTMAMLLAATRRIPGTHADLAGGVWRGDYYTSTASARSWRAARSAWSPTARSAAGWPRWWRGSGPRCSCTTRTWTCRG